MIPSMAQQKKKTWLFQVNNSAILMSADECDRDSHHTTESQLVMAYYDAAPHTN